MPKALSQVAESGSIISDLPNLQVSCDATQVEKNCLDLEENQQKHTPRGCSSPRPHPVLCQAVGWVHGRNASIASKIATFFSFHPSLSPWSHIGQLVTIWEASQSNARHLGVNSP